MYFKSFHFEGPPGSKKTHQNFNLSKKKHFQESLRLFELFSSWTFVRFVWRSLVLYSPVWRQQPQTPGSELLFVLNQLALFRSSWPDAGGRWWTSEESKVRRSWVLKWKFKLRILWKLTFSFYFLKHTKEQQQHKDCVFLVIFKNGLKLEKKVHVVWCGGFLKFCWKRFWGHFVSVLTEELFAPGVKGQEDHNQTTGSFFINFHDIWESYQLNIFSLKLSQTAKTRFYI